MNETMEPIGHDRNMHIAMINSYNVITGAVSVDDVAVSECPAFAFIPDEGPTEDDIIRVMRYFEDLEMDEHVDALKTAYVKMVSDESSGNCSCAMPDFHEYKPFIKCATCGKRITMG